MKELDKLMDLAGTLGANPEKYAMRAKGRNWQRSSTSQKHQDKCMGAAMLNLGRLASRIFFCRLQFCRQGERFRPRSTPYPATRTLPCAIQRKARAYDNVMYRHSSSIDQRRRRRASAPDPDSHRSSDHPIFKRASGSHDHRPVRRLEV